jgi:hypothetical protein
VLLLKSPETNNKTGEAPMTDDTKISVLEDRTPHQRIEELTEQNLIMSFQIGLLTGAVNNLEQHAIKSVLNHLKDRRDAVNDDDALAPPIDRLISWASSHVKQEDTPEEKPRLTLVESTKTPLTPAPDAQGIGAPTESE